jgi:hypothetical protein
VRSETKKFSLPAFALALLCFFLPFVSVSCQQQKIISFTGIQLVTGTAIEQPQMLGPRKVDRVNPEPFAVLAFLAGLAGLGVSFLKDQKTALAPAIFGGVGAVCLLLLKLKFDGDIQRQAAGILQVEYDVGFWLVLLIYLAAGVLNISIFLQSRKGSVEMQALSPAHPEALLAPPVSRLAPTAPAVAPTAVQPASTAAVPASAPSYGSLQCTAGSLAGQRFEVTRQGLLIGRDPAKCQIVVPDDGVSREHAWIVATDEGVVVIDRGSSNGTYVNSVEAGAISKVCLQDRDRILIGRQGPVFIYARN